MNDKSHVQPLIAVITSTPDLQPANDGQWAGGAQPGRRPHNVHMHTAQRDMLQHFLD